MNLAKQLLGQKASLRSASRCLVTSCLHVSPRVQSPQRSASLPVSPRVQSGQWSDKLVQPLLQPCTQQLRWTSTAQTCKFEVINVQDEEDFRKRVLESSKPVVVDFHATWCGPCKLLGPRLEKLLGEGDGSVVMAKVDIDDNSDLAMEYGVRSVPTVLGMKDGKVHGQFVGLIDDDQIQTFVDKLVVS